MHRADQIRRTLSLANLDHLLLLSQNPSGEREKLLKEVSRAGKELVWRSEDEQRLFPRDGERAIILALKRGIRELVRPLSYDQADYQAPLFWRFRHELELMSYSCYSGHGENVNCV